MRKRLRILHLEDVSSDAVLVQNRLKESKLDCEILVVDTKNDFLKALAGFTPDVVLSNSALPSFNAHEALIHLKKTVPAIPFIVVTATMSDEFAADMFLNGADDYIVKARLDRLPSAIDNALEKFNLEKERQKLLENLVESENRRIALVKNSADGLVILNAAGEFSYVSPSIKHILGYTEEELIQIGLPALSHPHDMLALGKVMETVLAHPGVPIEGHTGRILHKNGTWRWIEATVTNLLHDPAINGIVDNFRDVTERKLAEEKIIQANRLYAFISAINQTIVHASDEGTMFKEVCRIACDIGKFKAAWIGMIDEKQQTVNLVESCGILATELSILVNYRYDENGPHGHIVKTGTYYVSNNVQADPVLVDWKELSARRKNGSSIFLPIKRAGKTIGSFNLLGTEVDVFTPEEITLLVEAAGDISFSLNVFEKEKLKLAADEELRNALADVNKIMDSSLDMICTVNADGKFIKVSAASQLVLGYTPEELIGSNFMTRLYYEDADISFQAAQKIASGIPVAIFENRYVHKSGRVVPMLWSINWDDELHVMFCIAKDITEKKRLEKGIENERDRFAEMFLSAPACMAILKGPDHIFQMANEPFLILSEKKDIVGKMVREAFSEVERQGLLDVLDHVYKTGETFIAKEQLVRLDLPGTEEQKEVYCNFVYQVYHNGQNEIEGIFVFAIDITEQQKDKENLIEISERLLLATTSAKMGIWDWDIVNGQMTCDERMYELYGVKKQQFAGAVYDWRRQVHPDDVEKMYKEVNDAIAGICEINLEFRVIWPDTSIHFIEAHALVSRDEAGVGVRMIGINVDITERKVAEDKLVKLNEEVARSEKFFKGVIENSDDMMVIVDAIGDTIYVSPAVLNKFGYTNEECLNINLLDIVHPDDALIMQGFIEKIMMNPGVPMKCPLIRNLKKDGTYMWVDGILTNFLATEGINAIVANLRDVTEKKKLEDLLEKSNRLAAIGSWEIDVLKGTVFWSAITKEIREADPDFIPDLTTSMQFFEEGTHRNTIKKRVQDCIEKGTPWDEELHIITQKGNLKWIRTIGEGEFINGKCIRVYGSLQDIDTRKKAEIDVLKVYEEKNIILESIGDAFFAVDKNWIVTYWNNQAEKMLQTPKNKILGKHLWKVFEGNKHTASYRKYHEAIATKRVAHFEDYGAELNQWYDISAYPSDNGLSVFFKDITLQKRSEEEREKITADLILRNKDLEQFSYIISHNLRVPVANLIGLSNMLKRDDLSDDIKNKAKIGVGISVNKLDDVIRDLNSILKVRQEVNEHTQIINFADLTQHIKLSISSLIADTKATIIVDFSEVNQILTIKSYLYSIFYNLILNSLKYKRPGIPPVIQVKSQRLNNKIYLFFKDNGLGIDLEKRGDQVFGLYKRFHTHQAEGKGLGLYMVKTQVETIGGKISLVSEVDKGTEFKIEFKC